MLAAFSIYVTCSRSRTLGAVQASYSAAMWRDAGRKREELNERGIPPCGSQMGSASGDAAARPFCL
jgi:hypothetical protein